MLVGAGIASEPGMDASSGVIREGELYTLTEFKRRLAIQNAAWYGLKEQGLRTVRAGSRTYVLGADALRFFERLAESCPESKSSPSLAGQI